MSYNMDLTDISGQSHAKRALEIAAAGRHSLLLVGAPGTGRTMLARRALTILPALTEREIAELVDLYTRGRIRLEPPQGRPFRAPHHTASEAAIFGDVRRLYIGEIALATHGVLLLDELHEYRRSTIARLKRTDVGDTDVLMIGAVQPCPCGFTDRGCTCTPTIAAAFAERTRDIPASFDLRVRLDPSVQVSADQRGDTSATVRARVTQARAYLENAAYPVTQSRVLYVARTIAALEERPPENRDLEEARTLASW